jgi:hypothetical protein
MKSLTFFSCILLILFMSCQKDEEIINNTPPPSAALIYTIDDFTKFNSGNYWLYQHFKVDSLGETAFAGYDSCYHMGDTIISGLLYKRVYWYWLFPFESYLRDSSGYLMNGEWGMPLLSTAVVNDTFYILNVNDTTNGQLFTSYYTVTSLSNPVTVPAGTFSNVLDVTCFLYFHPPMDTSLNPLISHSYYAKDIGKILEQYYTSAELFLYHGNLINERRLVGYHVN